MKGARSKVVPTANLSVPKLRHHRPSGRAVVTLNGKDLYCGRWGTKAAVEEYDRQITLWLANGRRHPSDSLDISVAELGERYLDFAKGFYRTPAGRMTGEVDLLTRAVNTAVAMFGRLPASEFGPLKLKAVRERWIAQGRVRTQINYSVRRVIRMFRWGVENELVPGEVLHALKAVSGLRAGRSDAKEAPPIQPAPEGDVEAVLKFVTSPVGAMIEVQRLTGCRPGEVVQMSADRIDRTKKVWEYRPAFHKIMAATG
jgi:integrase